jgi:hypothetical protein
MDTEKEMASEAAVTAPKADVVALGKSTVLLSLNIEDRASKFSLVGVSQ